MRFFAGLVVVDIDWDWAFPLILAGVVGFVLGWGAYFLRFRFGTRKRSNVLFSIDSLFHIFCDDSEAGLALMDLSRKHRPEKANDVLYSMLHGVLSRRAGQGQRAFRIHQSLLARTDLDKTTRELIVVQTFLDLLAQSRAPEAREAWKQIPRKYRKKAFLRAAEARLFQTEDRWEEAAKIYRKLLADFPPSPGLEAQVQTVLLEWAARSVQRGQGKIAERIVNEILEKDPQNRQALLLRADVALGRQDFARAEIALVQYLQAHGKSCTQMRQRLKVLKQHKPELQADLEQAIVQG